MKKNGKSAFLEPGDAGRTEVQNTIIKEQFQGAGYDIMTAGKQLLEYYKK